MLMISAAPLGYASAGGYTATAASTGNEISFNYFTISLYLKDAETGDYSPVSTSSLNKAVLGYSTSGDTKTLTNDSYRISDGALCVKITEGNMPYDGTHYYTISSNVILRNSENNALPGITSSVIAKNESGTTVTDLLPNTYYGIEVLMTVSGSPQFTGQTLTQEASVIVTYNSSMNGSYYNSCSIQLSEISIVTPGYTPTDIPLDRTDDYGDHEAITIINDGNTHDGIADEDGTVNLTFSISSGKAFVLRLIPHGGKSMFNVSVKIGSNPAMTVQTKINGNVNSFVVYDGYSQATTRSTFGAIGTNNWFRGTGDVTVTITNQDGQHVDGRAQLDVIFE